MSILFISHDLGLVKKLADRVIVMYKGKIIEENTASKLFDKPKAPYTKGLLFVRPSTETRLYPLPTLKDYQDGEFIAKPQSSQNRSKQHKKLYAQ
jgi:peptide/nickel transport system ATP-binding protein